VLQGTGFGTSSVGSVTVGGVACPPLAGASNWNYSYIACTLPGGQGTNLQVQVVVDSQPSNLILFSYLDPIVFAVAPTSGPTAGAIAYVPSSISESVVDSQSSPDSVAGLTVYALRATTLV